MSERQTSKERVAIVKVVEQRLDEAVAQAVALLGGLEEIVPRGSKVLVKPNFVLPSRADRAIVTHPAVGMAVARLVQDAGGQALIADSPGASPPTRLGWQSTYAKMGWTAVARETGARLNTEVNPLQRVHSRGKLIRVVDTSDFVTDADVIISLPKLKSHGLMRYTGAVKNLFGTVPGVVKFGYHTKLQTVEQFAEMLLDVADFVRPALTLIIRM